MYFFNIHSMYNCVSNKFSFQIDAPVSPSGRGLGYFVSEMPHQVKQNHREQILDATKSEIVEAAQKFVKFVFCFKLIDSVHKD